MRLLSHDGDQANVRFTMDELLLLRELLDKFCAGGEADIALHEAEAMLRRLDSALERLKILPSAD
jgi:hypothetical protein